MQSTRFIVRLLRWLKRPSNVIEIQGSFLMSAIAKTASSFSLLEKWRNARELFNREYEHIRTVALGLVEFWRTRKTPPAAHQSLIRLFCATGGKSNDFISWFVSL